MARVKSQSNMQQPLQRRRHKGAHLWSARQSRVADPQRVGVRLGVQVGVGVGVVGVVGVGEQQAHCS